MRRPSHRRPYAVTVSLAAVAALLLIPAIASAVTPPSFIWSGAGGIGNTSWSDEANWDAGVPAGTVGTLDFPSASCPAQTMSPFCDSSNNIPGLTVEKLEIEGKKLAAEGDYYLAGEGIALGAGGLSMSTSAEPSRAAIGLPITLDAGQSWSITGNGGADSSGSAQLDLEKPLTGPAGDPLAIEVKNGGILNLDRVDNEVGPLTIAGAGAKTGQSASENGDVELVESPFGAAIDPELNAVDGKPINVIDAGFGGEGKIGPLTSTGADVEVGDVRRVPYEPEGKLETPGATFDSSSEIDLYMNEVPAPAPAYTSISQLTSTGTIELGGSRLGLVDLQTSCSSLPPLGETFTLISTAGSLSGAFGNAPKGADVALLSGCEEELDINYKESGSPQTVTGTVVPASLTDSASATSTNPSIPAEASDGPLTATASGGTGTVTVGQYASNPVGAPQFESSGKFIDVFLSTGNTFELLSFSDCELGAGTILHWWNSQANNGKGEWEAVTDQKFEPGSPPCITAIIKRSGTTPTLEQLTGTVFGVALPPASTSETPTGGGGSTTGGGGGSSTPPASSATPATTTPPATTAATGSVSLVSSAISVQSGGAAQVKLTCTGTATCAGKLTLTAKTKGKGKQKAKTETIATAGFSVLWGTTATVKLTLGAAGKALLKTAHGQLSATLAILESSPRPSSTQTKGVHLSQQKATKTKKGKK